MGLLDAFSNDLTSLVDNTANGSTYNVQDFQQNGFIVPPVATADGQGLPSQKLKKGPRKGRHTRNLIHWFVPEVGIIPMFINPQSLVENKQKLIKKERTKGGFVIQYWGEELTELSIDGHTGSSGIEGLNVLEEIYRAEQYMFDSIALTMAADSSISGINDLVDNALGGFGGIAGTVAGIGGTLLGAIGGGGTGTSSLPSDVPSLAAMATGIELYYNGKVFRGYFTSMTINESVDMLGMFKYSIKFTVTQQRGYRTNSFPWQRDPFINPIDADPGYRTFGPEILK
jgi:hypothetical protein